MRQDIAVTGSLNQKGEIQPIGGVNYKIEGFFDVCNAKGLTGGQGVIIPHQNVQNLMLRPVNFMVDLELQRLAMSWKSFGKDYKEAN